MQQPYQKENLEAVKDHFATVLNYPTITVDIGVRRLRFQTRKSPFHTQDLVFTMNFHYQEGAAGEGLLMGSLVSVYHAVKSLIVKLKSWFDDSLRRYVFFGINNGPNL